MHAAGADCRAGDRSAPDQDALLQVYQELQAAFAGQHMSAQPHPEVQLAMHVRRSVEVGPLSGAAGIERAMTA